MSSDGTHSNDSSASTTTTPPNTPTTQIQKLEKTFTTLLGLFKCLRKGPFFPFSPSHVPIANKFLCKNRTLVLKCLLNCRSKYVVIVKICNSQWRVTSRGRNQKWVMHPPTLLLEEPRILNAQPNA